MKILLKKIANQEPDNSFIIHNRAKLDNVPQLYKIFRDKKYGRAKIMTQPYFSKR